MIAGTEFIAMTPSMRLRIEATIEHLVLLLDAIDGDPDFEPGTDDEECGDDEPNLAGAKDDLEHDPAESGVADAGGMSEQWPHIHGGVAAAI